MNKTNKITTLLTAILLILTVTTHNNVFAWLLFGSALTLIIEIISEFIKLKSKLGE